MYLFADLQNTIFSKEAGTCTSPVLTTEKGPDNGDDGGSTETKTKKRYPRGDEDGGAVASKQIQTKTI